MSDVALKCIGLGSRGIQVPSFELRRGELIAVGIPAKYGPQWVEAAQTLAGLANHPNVSCPNAGVLVSADMFLGGRSDSASTAALAARGFNPLRTFLDALPFGHERDWAIRLQSLPATSRILILTEVAMKLIVNHITFISCGLDLSGKRECRNMLFSKRSMMPAIELFQQRHELDDLSMHDRVYES